MLSSDTNATKKTFLCRELSFSSLGNSACAPRDAQCTTLGRWFVYYAHVGSGPRKRLFACGVQVEPAAWPGPAFDGGPRLRQGLRCASGGYACCSHHTVIFCYAAGERRAYVYRVCNCRPELRRCHCRRRHWCCQHCRPPFVGVWEAIAGHCRGCALPQGLGGVTNHFSCNAAREKRRNWPLALQRH